MLDFDRHVLVDPVHHREETLTASEFDLLKLFAENLNRPLQRDLLLEVTAHREMEAFDRVIDLRVMRLRCKIELDPAHRDAIPTVRGVGYIFVPSTKSEAHRNRVRSSSAGKVATRLAKLHDP